MSKHIQEPLEQNPEAGVYLRSMENYGECNNDIYFVQFNPKKRQLATAGSNYMAYLWDLRNEEQLDFNPKPLPHITPHSSQQTQRFTSDVSSVHWNSSGNRIITSSSDMVSRVWEIDDKDEVYIKNVKGFNVCLLNSKFNEHCGNLVATGGMMSEIYVWDCESDDLREIACFDHSEIDSNFKGIEIEWQNSKNVAVTGKSKYIFLWNIDNPKAPICKWEGHTNEVDIIAWDPMKRMLASSSNEPYVLIWKPESNEPHLTLNKITSPVLSIKWSNLP